MGFGGLLLEHRWGDKKRGGAMESECSRQNEKCLGCRIHRTHRWTRVRKGWGGSRG